MAGVTGEMIETYRRGGVVLVRGPWKDRVEMIRAGIKRSMADPGHYAAENLKPGEGVSSTIAATGRGSPGSGG